MATMTAARLHAIGGRFSFDEVALPQPGPHDVLVKVATCGVIPNLLNVTRHFPEWYPFLPLPQLPAIFGLDAAGSVAAVGEAVRGFAPGDRVYVNPGLGCGQCRFCRQGETARCDAYTFMGYFGFGPGSSELFRRYPHAGYAEYLAAPANNLVRLPDNLSFAHAARLGYLGTAYAGLKKAALGPGQSLLVLGASGTLGVGASMLALAFGATRVLVAARDDGALQRLRRLDPARVLPIRIGAGELREQILQAQPGGVDAMIDTLGAKAPAQLSVDAMRAVARGGRIVQVGGVAGPIPIDPHPFMCAQLQYIGSLWFSVGEGEELARLIGSGLVDLSLLEPRGYPLRQLNEALEHIQEQADGFSNFHIVHG
ncbi:TPA: alcohol dehydrogenase catalytic domain-containing protein [Pseudomonas aeruginosa]|nr:alcohol dehydrogenase catalytic domain-containing protein [Pseudomonas aeruginosa]HBO1977321.1 alcohol dehydrogenase catalytic domain-containing protein [Pseudomonas aeruginosa]HBO2036533.1 alcohol dehydrogenase catalytic domain-containing protein [Pseudomonas aeruginosa]